MSCLQAYNICCPSCGGTQEVGLAQVVNVQTDPALREALLENRLNRVACQYCDAMFRIDLPLLYTDAARKIVIHWIPLSGQLTRDDVLEEFEYSLEELKGILPADVDAPGIRLVFTRVELVELIFLLEAGMNQRVVEYVKYSIYTRNAEKVDPKRHRLLLNVQDSTAEELLFVMQEVEKQELGTILRYGRPAYESMCGLYGESPEEFNEMFPGPCISARDLLLEDDLAEL
jgi:hypothetical protein